MPMQKKIIRTKLGLVELANQLCNFSQPSRMLGCSRDRGDRFKALCNKGGERAREANTALGRLILTESRRAVLETAKAEKEAHGEFEREHPGYSGGRILPMAATSRALAASAGGPASPRSCGWPAKPRSVADAGRSAS